MCNTDTKTKPQAQPQQQVPPVDAALTHAPTPIMSNRAAQKEPPPMALFSSTDEPIIVRLRNPPGRRSDVARVLSDHHNDDTPFAMIPLGILLEWAVRSLALSCPPVWATLWSRRRRRQQQQRIQQQQRNRQRKQPLRRPIGIPNHGQTCFLNATLQALAACGTFMTDYIEDVAPYSRTAELLRTVLQDMASSTGVVVDPRPLLAVTQLTRHQQHDAQECLGAILSAIAEEMDWNAYALEQQSRRAQEERDETVFPRIRKGKRIAIEERSVKAEEQSESDSDVKQSLSGSLSLENAKKVPLGERTDASNVEVHQDEKKQDEFTFNGGLPGPLRPEHRPTTFSSCSLDRLDMPASNRQAISFSQFMAAPKSRPTPTISRRWQYSATTPTPLSGWMGSRITCQTCQTTKPVSHQPFLNLPVAPLAHSVSACLARAVASDALENVTCDTCTAAEQAVLRHTIAACARQQRPVAHLQAELAATSFRGPALQDLRLARLPAVLSLHVQRRSMDPVTQRSHKTSTVVTIEPILDVAPFLSTTTSSSSAGQQPQPIPYRLVAVMVHCGGQADAGHYVCYRRHHGGRWWLISDAVVQPCEWSTVARCQAYMLFYTKME